MVIVYSDWDIAWYDGGIFRNNLKGYVRKLILVDEQITQNTNAWQRQFFITAAYSDFPEPVLIS